MTVTRFKAYGDIPAEIAFRIRDALRASGIDAEYGASNVSCSAYVATDAARLRISDHADHRGADHTIRINGQFRNVFAVWTYAGEDDDGTMRHVAESDLGGLDHAERETADFSHAEMDTATLDALVSEGIEFLTAAAGEAAE